MAGDTEKSDLLRIAEILLAHGVEFIVVGGQAETIFGSARVTVDIDLCYRRTKDNLKRLAAALHEIQPSLRNAPKDLPFVIDERLWRSEIISRSTHASAISTCWDFWSL